MIMSCVMRNSGLLGKILVGFGILWGLSACDQKTDDAYNPTFVDHRAGIKHEYILGVHPLHNPERLYEIFGPLTDYLNEKIPEATFKLEASRNYASYDKKLYAGKFEFALPNPYQTINSLRYGYHVFGKMGDDHKFRGIILVRKDSGIKKVTDLKGAVVSFPAPTALAATMMPQYYLQMHGIDVMKDIDIRYVGSQESSVMNVYLGNVAAAATWPAPWNLLSTERLELAAEVYPIWQTKPLVNNGLVVRDDVPPDLVAKVSKVLFSLHEHDQGVKILSAMDLSRFEEADNYTYKPVAVFLDKFQQSVRPLE